MTRARILADYVSSGDELALKAPLISPALVTPNLGTPSAGVMTNVTGIPLAGLSATGTAGATTYLRGDNSWQTAGSTSASDLASGTLATARMAAGTIIKTTSHTSALSVSQTNSGTAVESDATDISFSCTAGNKLHIWIIGGHAFGTGAVGGIFYGLRIIESGQSDIDIRASSLTNRGSTYVNDSIGVVHYTHTAVGTVVIIKRLVNTDSSNTVYWEANASHYARYTIFEEQV